MADDGAHGPPQDDVSMRGEAQNGGYAPSNGGEQDGQGDKDDGYRGEKMVKVLSLSPFLRSWNWDCARSGGLVGSVLHDGYVAAGFGPLSLSLSSMPTFWFLEYVCYWNCLLNGYLLSFAIYV
jgi:hypothetical protein